MTENNTITVSPEQGSETQEQRVDRFKKTRQGIKADITTARVLCHIVGTDDDTRNALLHRLRDVVKSEPTPDQIKHDAGLADALLVMLRDNDMILDQITEVVIGLQDNLIQKRKLKIPE